MMETLKSLSHREEQTLSIEGIGHIFTTLQTLQNQNYLFNVICFTQVILQHATLLMLTALSFTYRKSPQIG